MMPEPTSAELRAIPLDVLREYYNDLAEQTSVRTVAARAGIGHSTVHNFLHGSAPHPRVRRALALFYARTKDGGDGGPADARAEALAVLTDGVPVERREAVVREILALLDRAREHGESGP